MHLLKITPPHTPHHLTDSLPSMKIISRSKSAGVCTPSLKVGLAFAEIIRHMSVFSISGVVCQFLPPISFEAHNCRKCRLKVRQCACLPVAKSPLKISPTHFSHLYPFYHPTLDLINFIVMTLTDHCLQVEGKHCVVKCNPKNKAVKVGSK